LFVLIISNVELKTDVLDEPLIFYCLTFNGCT